MGAAGSRFMSKGRAKFKQSDVGRVLKAVRKAGTKCVIEIDPVTGRMIITTRSETQRKNDDNETEKWLAKHAHQR
jgi:hypothetical protein